MKEIKQPLEVIRKALQFAFSAYGENPTLKEHCASGLAMVDIITRLTTPEDERHAMEQGTTPNLEREAQEVLLPSWEVLNAFKLDADHNALLVVVTDANATQYAETFAEWEAKSATQYTDNIEDALREKGFFAVTGARDNSTWYCRGMKTKFTQYIVTTDAVTSQVEAENEDLAAQQFARSEAIFREYDIKTAKDLAEVAERLGGWAKIINA